MLHCWSPRAWWCDSLWIFECRCQKLWFLSCIYLLWCQRCRCWRSQVLAYNHLAQWWSRLLILVRKLLRVRPSPRQPDCWWLILLHSKSLWMDKWIQCHLYRSTSWNRYFLCCKTNWYPLKSRTGSYLVCARSQRIVQHTWWLLLTTWT